MALWLAAWWIAGIRIFEEHIWIYVPKGLRRDPLVWFGHTSLFYFALIVAVGAWLHLVLKRDAKKTLAAAAAGTILGILPPLIDVGVYGSGNFNYDYRVDFLRSVPWHFFEPPAVTPTGEFLTIWLSMALMGIYARVVGASWLRVSVVMGGHYLLILLFLTAIPSTGYQTHARFLGVTLNEMIALLFLVCAVLGFLFMRLPVFVQIGKRLPHILLAPSFVFLGSGLLGTFNEETLLAMVAMTLSSLIFAVHNDYYDRDLDRLQGRPQIVELEDVRFFSLLMVPWWAVLAAGHFWLALMSGLFLVVGHVYNADPLRLKCVFPLSYKTEGLLAFTCLLAGMMVQSRQLLEPQILVLSLIIAGGVSLGAMFKDSKDVRSDSQGNMRTLYVVLGSRGVSENMAHRIAVAGLVVCVVVPLGYFFSTKGFGLALAVAVVSGGAAVLAVALVHDRKRAVALTLWLLNVFIVSLGATLHNF